MIHTAKVEAGAKLLWCSAFSGIGLNGAIQGLRLVGANIVGVDTNPDKKVRGASASA